MGYIRDLERELQGMLDGLPEDQANQIVKFVKQKVYESYRNGQKRPSQNRNDRDRS